MTADRDTVRQAAEIAAAAMEWDWAEERNGEHILVPSPARAMLPAIEALADGGLLADLTCRACSGTGGTDLSNATCAVCQGTGRRQTGERE